MERAIGDRLAVLLVAVASLAVLWFGSGLAQAVALSHATRPLELTGSLGSESVGDYVRVFDYAVAPLREPAATVVEYVVYRWGTPLALEHGLAPPSQPRFIHSQRRLFGAAPAPAPRGAWRG